jgi:hypothetical protein
MQVHEAFSESFPCITAIFHVNCACVVTITASPHQESLRGGTSSFSNFYYASSEGRA